MIARGDLGVETPLEEVPLWQKRLIQQALKVGKPIITATHMMESMIHTIVPTRAEVSDVANAILDGTDAVMLSGETAVGNYPIETIAEVAKIAKAIEKKMPCLGQNEPRKVGKPITNAIARSIIRVCEELGIKAILVFTSSGVTARAIASFRPQQKIYAFTSSEIVARQMNLVFGVTACHLKKKAIHRDRIIFEMIEREKKEGVIQTGELVLVVSGANLLHQGATNMLEVQEVK
jgi:pyruvate kinase